MGYVRNTYTPPCPADVLDIIFIFYRIQMDSNILGDAEQTSFLNLLFETLQEQTDTSTIKTLDTTLLYRSSEHAYSAHKFHELCDNEGANIVMFHNEFDRVFGAFTSESWRKVKHDSGGRYFIADRKAFLFTVRPKLNTFGFKESKGQRRFPQEAFEYALESDQDYGPMYGYGQDIWIFDRCDKESCGAQSNSYDFDVKALCGKNAFVLKDYEVFAVTIIS